MLAREALARMLEDAEREGRVGPVETVGALSLRLGEGGAEGFLAACARAPGALEALPTGIQPWLRRALDLPSGDIDAAIAEGVEDIDEDAVVRLAGANRAWGTATGDKAAAVLERWIGSDRAGRVALLEELMGTVFTAKGEPRKASKKLTDADPDYEDMARELGRRAAICWA